MSLVSSAQDITQIEYWIDTDPGFGDANQITGFTEGFDVANQLETFTNGLSLGNHVIGVRSKDENGLWSHTNFVNIQITAPPEPLLVIDSMEYWIDTDPGLGEAIPISGFTNGPDVQNIIESFVSPELVGHHVIGVRSMDSAGKWSHTNFVNIQVKAPPQESPDIVEIEYFWESDDGLGNESIVLTDPMPVIDDFLLQVEVPDSLVGDSIKLFVRSKDSFNKWSHTNLVNYVELFPLADGTINEEITECNEWTSPDGLVTVTSDTLYCAAEFDGSEFQMYCYDVSIQVIDTSVDTLGNTITASSSIGDYQWLDCEDDMSIIDGETNVTFSPLEDGNYALEISLSETCVDTSDCVDFVFTSVTDLGVSNSPIYRYYPNPATNNLIVEVSNTFNKNQLDILDMQGRVVLSNRLTHGIQSLALPDLSSGTYLVRFTNDTKIITQKLLID